MKLKKHLSCLAIALLLPLCLLSAGCKKQTQEQSKTSVDNTIPVKILSVSTKPVDLKYKSLGSIESRDVPIVRAQVAGHIEELLAKRGDQVTKGQLLAQISSNDEVLAVSQAKTGFVQAQANYDAALLDMQRKGILAQKGVVSKSDYDHAVSAYKIAKASVDNAKIQLQAAENQLAKTKITAPINGVVDQVSVSVGDQVSPGTAMLQVINPANLRAVLPFPEQQALQIQPGQAVDLSSLANPDQVLNATVTALTPSIDPKNRAFQVIVDFQNTNNWIPGASVRGFVYVLKGYQAIAIPQSSLVLRQQGYAVFTVQNGIAKITPVQTGFRTDGNVVVIQGLKDGDQVVVDGADYLSDGTPVKVVK